MHNPNRNLKEEEEFDNILRSIVVIIDVLGERNEKMISVKDKPVANKVRKSENE